MQRLPRAREATAPPVSGALQTRVPLLQHLLNAEVNNNLVPTRASWHLPAARKCGAAFLARGWWYPRTRLCRSQTWTSPTSRLLNLVDSCTFQLALLSQQPIARSGIESIIRAPGWTMLGGARAPLSTPRRPSALSRAGDAVCFSKVLC